MRETEMSLVAIPFAASHTLFHQTAEVRGYEEDARGMRARTTEERLEGLNWTSVKDW